jgi:hypothetical protein
LSNQENVLLDFVLLCALVIVNYLLLRWCVRQVVVDAQWLRNPGERDEIVREFALDRIGRLWNPYHRDELVGNPLYRLLGWLLLIAVIFWGDSYVIHHQWPWLLTP